MKQYKRKFEESLIPTGNWEIFVYEGRSSGLRFNGIKVPLAGKLKLHFLIRANNEYDALEKGAQEMSKRFGEDWSKNYSSILMKQFVIV